MNLIKLVKGYDDLNKKAKEYLIKKLKRKCLEKFYLKDLFKRCEKEIDLLYEKKLLFIIEYLYKFKKENKSVRYHFRGTTNNLLILYVLNLSEVNPLEYNLPYELFNDSAIQVDLTNVLDLELVYYLDRQTEYFKIVSGIFEKEDLNEINTILENHYLLLPCDNLDNNMLLRFNDLNILETTIDYRKYNDKYVSIRIDNKCNIKSNKVCLENVINNNFEKEIIEILKPKTISDFIKIKSLAHGTNVWKNNQDILVKEGKINLSNLIATREDILEYLLNHSIQNDKALEILNFVRRGLSKKEPNKWKEYVDIMKKNNCEDMFIEIFSNILFIFGRGQAVSDCLYVLDKDNYI